MKINWFEFGGTRSDSVGLLISEKRIYTAPQRDVEPVYVPGRNGDVLIDHGGYRNVPVSYLVYITNLPEASLTLRSWLQGTGYKLLRDSYDPSYVRFGYFSSVLDPDEIARTIGQLKVEFSCKPFRYRVDSLTAKTSYRQSGFTITNPEAYASLPYIRINGSGNVELRIGNRTFAIKNIHDYIELDSELMCAFKGSELCNHQLNFTEFPSFVPGDNLVQWTGTVSSLEIIPRWMTI